MPDKIRQKVINIFDKHKKHLPLNEDEKVVTCKDGICYVCVKRDENGNYYDEDHLIEKAGKCHYIIRVMVHHDQHPYIYNYKVPGEKLLDFLKSYINEENEGKIIEIENYYPHELA